MEKITARVKARIEGREYDRTLTFGTRAGLMEVDLGNLIGCFQEMNGRNLKECAADYITSCYGEYLTEYSFT